MLLPKDYLVKQAADGRIRLSIPAYFYDIDTSSETLTYHRKGFVPYPDDWVMICQWKGTKIIPNLDPKVRKPYVFLSEKGWNNMKTDILDAFETRKMFRDCGVTGHIKGFDRYLMADDFEKIAEEFYDNIRNDGQSHYLEGLVYKYAREEMRLLKKK